ncbi:MAG: 4-hydroxy-tetrahydrodipicolinate reductase [Candidatus Omnitrophota bacterium]
MINLAISGCGGRMGQRILNFALIDKAFKVKALLERSNHALIGKEVEGIKVSSDVGPQLAKADVLIEFTTPESTVSHLKDAVKQKTAVVIGTTGLSVEQMDSIAAAAKVIPIVFSPNMSVGVNLVFTLAGDIARALGKEYDIEIVEAHHKAKKDAPSGTAKKIAELIAEATQREIPTHSLRVGDVVGDHTIVFSGNSERIELKHQAHSRDVFALGALKAAKFVVDKRPKLYDMRDVLGV